VSSHKIKSDFFNTSIDLNVISSRFPIGVDTMYSPEEKEFIINNE
tara:strand:- start:412 stop:546 length:135 start_codon:yes stop_codon:yes gene_type:complete